MTQTTGSNSQASAPQTEEYGTPWEDHWNHLASGLKKLGSDMVKTIKEPFTPPPGMQSPWEMIWNDPKPPAKPRVVKAKPAITDGGWDEINAKYAAGSADRKRGQIETLEYELSVEKNPKNREILKREIERAKRAS